MTYSTNITHSISNTDLVRLQRLTDKNSAEVLVKLESRNPCSAVIDRIGLAMILAAEKVRILLPGGTMVDPTSGNTSIALAMVVGARGNR